MHRAQMYVGVRRAVPWKTHMASQRRAKRDGLRHLTENERAALAEFVQRLRAKFGDQVLLVRLFGSKARGDFDEESDIDVLVVVTNGDWQFGDEVALEACDSMLEYNVVISSLVLSADRYHWMRSVGAPFYREAERDGVDLWTRTPDASVVFA